MHKRDSHHAAENALLSGIIESAMDAIVSADADQNIVIFNRAAEQIFGYAAAEILGKPLDVLMPERFRGLHRRHVAEFGRTSVAARRMGALGVVYGRRANGEEFPMEASISFTSTGDDKANYTAILRDVTARLDSERKIAQLTRAYSALSRVNHLLVKCGSEAELFNETCRIAVEAGGMKMAWIGVANPTDQSIKAVASYGNGREYLDGIRISVRADLPEGNGPTGMALREGHSVICQDFLSDPTTAPFHARAEPYGWRASATFPILRDGAAYAVLTLYHPEKNPFTAEIIDLITEMAANIGHGLDLLDFEQVKRKAEESMRLAATIYQSSAEAVMVTDENNRIIDVNPAFTLQTGFTLDDLAGKNPSILQSGRHDKEFYRLMWRDLLERGHWQGELWDRRKDGSLHIKLANISVIRREDGTIYRHVAQFFDITDRKQKEELIWRQANFDSLTGLPNRRLFYDRLGQQIKKAHRDGNSLALLFIDLDRFKEINDTLGHSKGDVLLEEAARRISVCVRETDTVARLGGDEFTLIVPEFGGRLHLERIAQKIIHELAQPFELGDGDSGYISASIGITLYPDDAGDIDTLLKHADQAMYVAKAEGRNRFGYFTPSMQWEARQKLALTNDLRQALPRNELLVYYQPILELATGKLAKAEALLRWQHPEHGIIGPAVFIPLAEEAGLIHEIGEWVFQAAAADVARWRERLGRIVQVGVNRSPVQFERGESNWAEVLGGMGLPGNAVVVEITEGLLLKKSEKIRQCLLEYRNCGIEVAIDDFGTGFSALSYLKQFDIDYLKIDRSFIKDLVGDDNDQALTEALIAMAHKLGIKTIAEGVENRAQHDLLQSFGCDYVQGYLYSRPVPRDQFEALLFRTERG